MLAACVLALCTGLLSLSMEVLWVRLVSFSYHTAPQSFTFVLMFFLLGIAFGAVIGKRYCRTAQDLWVVSGITLLFSSVCDIAGPFIYANFVFANQEFPNHLWLIGGTVILLTALFTSIVFPIAHHLGTPAKTTQVGHAISRVYVSNIAGATLGPILTGFVLLAYVTTQQAFIICGVVTLLVAIYCLWHVLSRSMMALGVLVLSCQLSLLMISPHKLMNRVAMQGYGNFIKMVENQYGIATVYTGPYFKFKDNHVVTGNNAYDGSTNLNPAHNFNGINRVIIMSALVDQPKHVLVIGLSIGSWLTMVTTFPGVESIDVIEINPGYLELIKDYPQQQAALKDPRVHLYIDDGRRWLKSHPDSRYDMVVMNTSYHWRAYATNLLSQNFLSLIKQHMNRDAVVTYNSTSSPDVLYTAASVFKFAYLYRNFVVAADFDWRSKMHTPQAQARLAALKLNGQPLFANHAEDVIHSYLHESIVSLEQVKQNMKVSRPLEIITDHNMIPEFKYGRNMEA